MNPIEHEILYRWVSHHRSKMFFLLERQSSITALPFDYRKQHESLLLGLPQEGAYLTVAVRNFGNVADPAKTPHSVVTI